MACSKKVHNITQVRPMWSLLFGRTQTPHPCLYGLIILVCLFHWHTFVEVVNVYRQTVCLLSTFVAFPVCVDVLLGLHAATPCFSDYMYSDDCTVLHASLVRLSPAAGPHTVLHAAGLSDKWDLRVWYTNYKDKRHLLTCCQWALHCPPTDWVESRCFNT